MSKPEPGIRVNVDLTNPGQFFACCGLLELAERLWPGAEGWFEGREFCVACEGALPDLVQKIYAIQLIQIDPEDATASPILIEAPFRELRLDWWKDELAGGKELKVWAGTMESIRIAQAMLFAMRDTRFAKPGLLDVGVVAYDPDDAEKKVEPFYFDARRGPNAHSRDVGFAPNDLQLTTTAFPAVEFLCLAGLQRCRPAKTSQPRIYDYHTWQTPLPPILTPAAVSGLLSSIGSRGFRFENWYRTGQKKHKAFRSATPLV
jgi:CRISPR-associated protein Csb3